MATLKDLSRRMKKLDKELDRKVNDVAKAVASAVLTEIVSSTPADTTQAISNWQVAYNGGNFTNLPPHVEGEDGETRGASSAETLAVGMLFIKSKRPGVPLHISNGLDYIQDINAGFGSDGSPLRASIGNFGGFKEKALKAGQIRLQQSKLDF